MSNAITVKLTGDEIEMLVDALEVDLEGYVEAATRIQALMTKLQDLIED